MTRQPSKSPAVSEGTADRRQENACVDGMLDEALRETFPASDPPALLEPAPRRSKNRTTPKQK